MTQREPAVVCMCTNSAHNGQYGKFADSAAHGVVAVRLRKPKRSAAIEWKRFAAIEAGGGCRKWCLVTRWKGWPTAPWREGRRERGGGEGIRLYFAYASSALCPPHRA